MIVRNVKKRFKTEADLKKHRCIYNGPRPHLCKVCGKRFNRLYHLERHVELHERKNQSAIKVTEPCSYSEAKHDSAVDIYNPEMLLDQDSNSKNSSEDQSVTVNKKFECYICSSRWSSFKKYKVHFLSLHQDVQFNACHICTKQFSKSSKVKRHLLIHFKEKKYTCDACFKTFSTQSTKNRHMKVHTGVTRLACSQCPETFNTKTDLKKHTLLHQMSENADFKCTQCESSFSEEKLLNDHILAHHNLLKEFQCNVCERKCKDAYNLKQHKLVHSSLKKLKCFKCNKLFNTTSDLNKHVLLHNDLKPYSCYFCDKSFSRNNQRRKHLASCSREKRDRHLLKIVKLIKKMYILLL
ncbi:zinc finger protein 26 [Caerostris extrusa]|uniref:Zinc finger protein 26 n=1 Tax=Caerostris extrusa TaxID=172846 RepID=A0AAV4V215_CAEEX|nr:zinc finger protein 26 [Caerostris extrusa]